MKGNRIRRAGPSSACLLFALAASGVGACSGGSSPPARGFGSRQLVSISDPTLVMVGFATKIEPSTGSDGATYYSAVNDLDVLWYATGDGMASPVQFWELGLRNGAVKPLGPTLPQVEVPPPDLPPGYLECEWRSMDQSPPALSISDPVSGAETVIESVTYYSRCPRHDDRQLYAIRRDETGRGQLWAGPFDALERVPLGTSIVQLVPIGADKDQLVVLAASDAASEDFRIDRISLPSFTVTTLVPATLSPDAAWTDGASMAAPVLESDRLARGNAVWLGGWGISYPRQMRDGSTIMFARRFEDPPGRELALFPIVGSAARIPVEASPPGQGIAVPFAAWWEFAAGGTGVGTPTSEPLRPSAIYVWDIERSRITSCPLPSAFPGLAYGRLLPETKAIVIDGTSSLDSSSSGPLLLYLADQEGAQRCRVMADAGASQDVRSSEALVWRENLGGEESTLRAVRFDGSEPRTIGTGWLQFPHFVSPSEVQFFFGSDLVFVDLRDDPVRLNYLAEGVFGSFINWGTSVITGYGRSSQDGTGNLGVVHRPTGERRLISTAVGYFLFGYRPGDGLVDVVYRVRGRNASDQDGIWIATIPYDELD